MSYLHTPYDPHGEDDDDPCTNMPAPSRGQTCHSAGPFTSFLMPATNHNPRINNSLRNVIEEPDTGGCYPGHCNPARVAGRQQQYGGQPPQYTSLLSPFIPRHPQGTASSAHPRPHYRHVDGIQQGPSHAQGGWRRAVAPLPPQLNADQVLYAQGEMPESRRTRNGGRMLPANKPNPGYWNMNNARQDEGSIPHTAVRNARHGVGDLQSTEEHVSSQPELLDPAMIGFDDNAARNMGSTLPVTMGNTASLGDPLGPYPGILSQEMDATLQTPRVNTGYEFPGGPNYEQRTSGQPLEAFPPVISTYPPLQPRHPIGPEGSLNNDRSFLGSTPFSTHYQPLRRNTGTMNLPVRPMTSPSGLLPSVLEGATNQSDAASRKAGHTLYSELAASDVIHPHLPASRRASIRDSTRSHVVPQPRPPKRRRNRSSSLPQRSRQRKGRKLAESSDYKRSKTAFVRRKRLACDRCRASKIKCKHWDEKIFRSQYEASNAPDTPTSHATAPETRRAVRRHRSAASNRALAPLQHLETVQTPSSATLIAHPGQADRWGNTLGHVGEQLDVPARLTSPVSAAPVLQGHPWHQGPANFDTMTHTASESVHGHVHPMQSPLTAGETYSQETAVMQMGVHLGSHINTELELPTTNLFLELDEVTGPQQYPSVPEYDFTLLSLRTSNPNDDWDPSPSS